MLSFPSLANRITAMMNRTLQTLVTAVAGLALLLGSTGCAGGYKIDHFKVYQVNRVETEFPLRLLDQFDPAAKDARTVGITHFANAVEKTHGGTTTDIQNRHAHLTFYRIDQQQPEPLRTVRYRNQFGQHSVNIREAVVLLVPSEKISDDDSQFPQDLDHFKCYRVVQVNTAPPLPVVDLVDQFGAQNGVQVMAPRLFCNPVEKQRPNGEVTPITNKNDHLAIYEITADPENRDISIENQFQTQNLSVIEGMMLAVPTTKQVFVEIDD